MQFWVQIQCMTLNACRNIKVIEFGGREQSRAGCIFQGWMFAPLPFCSTSLADLVFGNKTAKNHLLLAKEMPLDFLSSQFLVRVPENFSLDLSKIYQSLAQQQQSLNLRDLEGTLRRELDLWRAWGMKYICKMCGEFSGSVGGVLLLCKHLPHYLNHKSCPLNFVNTQHAAGLA